MAVAGVVPDLKPREDEVVIDKITMSAFEGTFVRCCGYRARDWDRAYGQTEPGFELPPNRGYRRLWLKDARVEGTFVSHSEGDRRDTDVYHSGGNFGHAG